MEITANKLAKWLKDSVKWLVGQQMGCTTLKLDDRLAVCVGWLPGFGDEKRDDVIQGEGGDADYAIVAGIKVWTSDDMRTDYDFIAFPYHEDGENEAFEYTISPKENYAELAEAILKDYDSIKGLDIEESGEINDDAEVDESTDYTHVVTHTVEDDDTRNALIRLRDKVTNGGDIDACMEEYFDLYTSSDVSSIMDRNALANEIEELSSSGDRENMEQARSLSNLLKNNPDAHWFDAYTEQALDARKWLLDEIGECLSEGIKKPINEGEDESTRIRSAVLNHFREGYLEDKFFDLIVDLIERVDGNYLDEDAIYEAMDAGMVYNDDQWTMIMHYCTPSDANFNEAWDAMYMDIVSICEDLAGEVEDED